MAESATPPSSDSAGPQTTASCYALLELRASGAIATCFQRCHHPGAQHIQRYTALPECLLAPAAPRSVVRQLSFPTRLRIHHYRGQLVQSKDERKDEVPCRIAQRGYIDTYVIVDLVLLSSVVQGWYLTPEIDLVVLRTKSSDRSVMGKVTFYKAKGSENIAVTLRVSADLDPGLMINTEWRLTKVFRWAWQLVNTT